MRAICFCFFATLQALSLSAADSLESVLAKYETAVGGKQAWQKIEGLRYSGMVKLSTGEEMPFAILRSRKWVRMEHGLGKAHMVKLYDGKKGWVLDAKRDESEPQLLTSQEMAGLIEMTDLEGPLFEARKKNHSVVYKGIQEAEGKRYHCIELETASAIRMTYYLDLDRFLPMIVVKAMAGCQEKEVEHILAYEKKQGIFIKKASAFGCYDVTAEQSTPRFQEWFSYVVTRRELNPKLDEDQFCLIKTPSLLAAHGR